MCGIAGWIGRVRADDASAIAEKMTRSIRHRGPDDAGVWRDDDFGVVLVHQRLAVLDLTDAGHQPMSSSCGRFVLIYNGEIYNHESIRARLEHESEISSWRGRSDTETLLEAFSAWGVEKTLQATVGMFAFALWDRADKILTLARDRMGEKPLYYGWQNGDLIFGSELKALTAHPSCNSTVDRNALTLMLRHNCIPAPFSIYAGIKKLMPGHYLQIPVTPSSAAMVESSTPYWSYDQVAEAGLKRPFDGSTDAAADALESVILESVGTQLISDVPIGAFLSGGIDSSVVVAAMQAQSSSPVRTFTIGFSDDGYDEAKQARQVSRYLGTSHTELEVTPKDTMAVIPDLPNIYCEPFSDSSQIPTYLVSALASEHVKVVLSGDGGDELFGGYNRYSSAYGFWRRSQALPLVMIRAISKLLRANTPAEWDRLFVAAGRLVPSRFRLRMPGEKAHKLAGALRAEDESAFYTYLVSHWQNPSDVVIGGTEPPVVIGHHHWPEIKDPVQRMMILDALTYLPDDILTKVDRAAMANSLEARIPFLDHRMVEFAWRIPQSMKIRDGVGKWLLRQVLCRFVPEELVDRPKMGFGVPLDNWLRGPLRDWAEDLLDEARLSREGYFEPGPIRHLWDRHLSGQFNEQHAIWDVLMFQSWLAER